MFSKMAKGTRGSPKNSPLEKKKSLVVAEPSQTMELLIMAEDYKSIAT